MSKNWKPWLVAGTVLGATAVYVWQQKQKRALDTAVRPPFSQQYGPWAIVTGAARKEGLGYGFARHLAGRHLNLVLVDVPGDELAARAAELRQKYYVKVETVTLDLSKPDCLPALQAATDKLEIGLLVCSHLFTLKETLPILQMDLDTQQTMPDINVRAYTTLVEGYGRRLAGQQHGGIIIVSSQGGLHDTPSTGAYSANKTFPMMLGESLRYELRDSNVDVLVLAPGLTNTQDDALAGYPSTMLMDVDPVVMESLNGLGKKQLVIPGPVNKLFHFATTHLTTGQQSLPANGEFIAKGLHKN